VRSPAIDGERLLARIRALGDAGRGEDGALTRLAASDVDRTGRDLFVGWLRDAGLDVRVDRIGNVFGLWEVGGEAAPLMMGSHIDSVVNAGIYDGPYGVLAGLAVIEALRDAGVRPDRSLVVGAFTNEEGVRYAPDMMGSLVHAGGLATEAALATRGSDGTVLGEELLRIGYAGELEPGSIVPSAFLELHIEQGPVLEAEGMHIGAVADLQGISWQRVRIRGVANHAGTAPIRMRHDAGLAAARVVTFLRDLVSGSESVATVGSIRFAPDAINVVPEQAEFTVDLRDPDEATLRARERALDDFLGALERSDGVSVETERLARTEPVHFDETLVAMIEDAARARALPCRRMVSGAGHDAQMMARICPAAMIFVPSRDGISHNPREHTDADQLLAGAEVLLDVARRLVSP
jgi:N-carbamoyl-L-amino-acid hydrolase